MHTSSISFFQAIIFIMNMMIGSGLFLNTIVLEKLAPGWSFIIYVVVGVIMFPLVVVCFRLLQLFPRDTLYDLGNRAHPLLAFLMSWGYFFGKLATTAVGIIVAGTIIAPLIGITSIVIVALFLLWLSVYFMRANKKLGEYIPFYFFSAKIITVLFVFGVALRHLFSHGLSNSMTSYAGCSAAAIPFVIFSFAGFEAFFSVASRVKNAQKNAGRVVLIGFLLVLATYVVYQLSLIVSYGSDLASFPTFRAIFDHIAHTALGIPLLYYVLIAGMAVSAFGSAYGLMYSNMCNLHNLACQGIIPGSTFITQISHGVMRNAAWMTGLVVLVYIICFSSTIVILQQLSALATLCTYISCTYLYARLGTGSYGYRLLICSALASCCVLCAGVIYNGLLFGFAGYKGYALVVTSGLLIYSYRFFWMPKIRSNYN